MSQMHPIDFVIPWVDDRDPIWREKKARYANAADRNNSDGRYRDWDMLKYWFRGVEQFAPWVRYIFFVTDDQLPTWLDTTHPKLKHIKHTDYIPQEYLPTFSSHVIEWNFHRIEELSETFVYFNDDVFLIDRVTPEDFFVDGLPCDRPNIGALYPNGFFTHILFHNIELLNRHFTLKGSIRKNLSKWLRAQTPGGLAKLLVYGGKTLIPNSTAEHIHMNLLKKTFEELWTAEKDCIEKTCSHKFREQTDVNAYCVRDWQLFSGQFRPKRSVGKLFHTTEMDCNDAALTYLRKQKGKVVCLNDTEDETNFEEHRAQLIAAFESLLPNKSTFER